MDCGRRKIIYFMQKKLTLALVFMVAIIHSSNGQSEGKGKSGKWARGTVVGGGISRFKIKETNWRQTTYKDSLNSVKPEGSGAVTFGFLLRYQMGAMIALRTKLQLSIEGGRMIYERKTFKETIKAPNVYLDFPVHFTLHQPNKAASPYLILGSTIRFGLGNDPKVEEILPTKQFTITADLGAGIEFRQKTYIIAPEVYYSRGMTNIKGSINNLYNNVLESSRKQGFYLALNFRSL